MPGTEDDDWFVGWVEHHCEATGADASAARALLANRENFCDRWAATPAELGEVTARLVRNLRTPKFANEHCDAVGRELNELRTERPALPPVPAADAPACDACLDTGIASIPHPACVRHRRVELHRGPGGQRSLLTGTAVCDRPGCAAGARQRQANANYASKPGASAGPMARLGDLERWHEVGDLAAALRRAESERAAAARAADDGPNPFAAVFARLHLRIREAADGAGPESRQDAA